MRNGSSHPRLWQRVSLAFQLEQLDEHLVPLAYEFGRITRSNLLADASCDPLAKLGIDRKAPKVPPHPFGCLPERLVEQRPDATLAAREMQVQKGAE